MLAKQDLESIIKNFKSSKSDFMAFPYITKNRSGPPLTKPFKRDFKARGVLIPRGVAPKLLKNPYF